MNLKKVFLKHCENNVYEINQRQLSIIDNLLDYYKDNFDQSLLNKIFKKNNYRPGFYLVGDVGVGKTMILNFFFDQIKNKKLRLHFNEFMIQFHDFIFKNKDKENTIEFFIKDLKKKTELIYFDEFQVTNIVDAMILGKLFKRIFEENIKVIFSSNIEIDNLYKDGLQRDQFIPFIKTLKKNCFQNELSISEDYRSSKNIDLERFLSPINETNNFVFNKFFRKLTKNKEKTLKVLEIKGRKLVIENFHERVVKFKFDELCDRNLGSEDYLVLANNCDFLFIENLPDFNEYNSNQQNRFITLIDILYDKKIPVLISSETNISNLGSSKRLRHVFQRTLSRLYELTSPNMKIN